MSIKSIKDDLATLHTEKPSHQDDEIISGCDESVSEIITVSANGIRFRDPRPLKYCKDYEILVKPSLKCCQHCNTGLEVLHLTEEQKTMFLNQNTGELAEKEEALHRPRDPNFVDGVFEPTDAIPVIAFLTIATVKEKNAISQRIVYDRFKDMADCPRNTRQRP